MVAATFTMKFRSAFAVIAAAFTAFAIIITLEGTDAMEVFNENEDDYVDLFGSSTPKPEVSDTTPPPFWTSENQRDKVDMVLKREIFTLYKIVYPAVLLVWTGITVLCLLGVPILVLLCIMQSHATRVVEEMEKKAKDNEEEEEKKAQQPFESSEEWQRMLPEDD